jgi:hypothetical protein
MSIHDDDDDYDYEADSIWNEWQRRPVDPNAPPFPGVPSHLRVVIGPDDPEPPPFVVIDGEQMAVWWHRREQH